MSRPIFFPILILKLVAIATSEYNQTLPLVRFCSHLTQLSLPLYAEVLYE